MLPYINIGPLTLPVPGIIVILGLWLGLSLAERYSLKHRIAPDVLYSLVYSSLFASLITARLVYVLRFFSSFIENPISIILPNLNTLDPIAGLAGGLIAAIIFGNRKKLGFWPIADALMPVIAVLSIAFPLANLASGDAFGTTTSLPWGIDLWGARRHPVQTYEALGASLVLLVLWPSKIWITKLKPGGLFLIFLALISLNRLIVEVFRADNTLILDHYRTTQVWALTILLNSLSLLKNKLPDLTLEEIQSS